MAGPSLARDFGHTPGAVTRLESLSIVLPCRDEERNIGPVVEEALAAVVRHARLGEVVLVDDGSSDGSVHAARAAVRRAAGPEAAVPLRVVRHGQGRGYGAALRSGFGHARSRWILYADADRQFDLREASRLVALVPEHDVVCGYRSRRADGIRRLLLGRAWSGLVNGVLGTGLRDVNCGLKLLPRALFERIDLESRGALVDAELIAKARRLGFRVAEVAVTHRPRPHGRATGTRPAVIARALGELWRARSLSLYPAKPLAKPLAKAGGALPGSARARA